MRIAVDAMGGDYAPAQIVLGAVEAVRKYKCDIVLVGDEEKIKAELAKTGMANNRRLRKQNVVIEKTE